MSEVVPDTTSVRFDEKQEVYTVQEREWGP